MDEVILTINLINSILEDIILEDNISYLGSSTKDIFSVYSSDFCDIMIHYYPGATVMIDNNLRKCAIMINGVVYDSYGISNKRYHIANEEEINYIRKGMPKLSIYVVSKIYNHINSTNRKDNAYSLRKDSYDLT